MEIIHLLLQLRRIQVTFVGGFPVIIFLAHHNALVYRLVKPKKHIHFIRRKPNRFRRIFFKEGVTGKASSTYPDPLYID